MKRLLVFLSACPLPLASQSTVDPALPHAYLANSGWVNFHPSAAAGVIVQESFLSGYAYAANTGWIHLGDGSPDNSHTYTNASGTDFGVNRDSAGNLAGYAYSANTGWIHFGWAGSSDPDRPRVILSSGQFAGYAYSANVGWLNLGSGSLRTATISYPDSDSDGIADAWEYAHFGNLASATLTSDADHDGHSDAAEYQAGTDPADPGDYLKIVSQTLNAPLTGNTLVFTSNAARLYRIEIHTELGGSPWSDSGLGTFTPDAGSTTSRFVTFATGPRLFFRAVTTRPLSP
jgi:hypothetical protein